MELIEEFDKRFEELLTEELSIADNVYIEARNICQMLRKEIERTSCIPFNMDGVCLKRGDFEYPVSFDSNITVKWTYYNFLSQKIFEKEFRKLPYKNSFNYTTHTLSITVFAINQKIENRTLEDSVMHEIGHLYQMVKSNNGLLKREVDRNAYQNASINKNNTQNQAIRAIGNIFFYSKDFEQDGQVNGAYYYMLKRYEEDGIPPTVSYKETDAYAVLIKLQQDLKYCLNSVNDKNRNIINTYIKNNYGDYTFKKIYDLGIKAIKRLSEKLVKVCAKVNIDIQRQNIDKDKNQTILY